MDKDFDRWNTEKKRIDMEARRVFAHPREVWWCALGLNIGAEINGKNDNFERPVLIVKIYNTETLLVLPITSKEKDDKFHCKVSAKVGQVWVKLTQIRVISSHRLLRKLDILAEAEYKKVEDKLRSFV